MVLEVNGDSGRSHRNCFDLLRLFLSVMVVFTHCYLICGCTEPLFDLFKQQFAMGTLAVLGFFGVSGYLVTASWDRSSGAGSFLRKRALRIFPGFWVCLLFVAFVVGPLLYLANGEPVGSYPLGGDNGAGRFVAANWLLVVNQWSIGTAVSGMPYTESLNGSLWSIFPEFACYLMTVSLGLLAATRENRNLLVCAIAYTTVVHAGVTFRTDRSYAPAFGPSFLIFNTWAKFALAYLFGACLWVFRDRYRVNPRGALAMLIAFALLLRFGGLALAGPFLIPALLIYVAQLFECPLRWDLSYGIYLYHFPVLQLLATAQPLRDNPPVMLAVGLLVTSLVAALSWRFVEKPALSLKSRRKRGAHEEDPKASLTMKEDAHVPLPGK